MQGQLVLFSFQKTAKLRTKHPLMTLLAYEIEGLGHAQHQESQQPCSYDIDHMDAPTEEEEKEPAPSLTFTITSHSVNVK